MGHVSPPSMFPCHVGGVIVGRPRGVPGWGGATPVELAGCGGPTTGEMYGCRNKANDKCTPLAPPFNIQRGEKKSLPPIHVYAEPHTPTHTTIMGGPTSIDK